MALSRLLLLCMVASEVWDAETKPIDFVCNKDARSAMNIVTEMKSALKHCNGARSLSTQVQLPCTELHIASWENKSVCRHMYESKILHHHHEKRGDIVASLRLLTESVEAVKGQSQPECASPLLQRLGNNIDNYQHILTNLQLNESVVSPALSCVPRSTGSLSAVLHSYSQLITGKLEWFIMDLEEDICASQ